MKTRGKYVWFVTAANAAVLVILVLQIWGILIGLAVLAPYIYTWPLFALMGIGLVLSIAGLRPSASDKSRIARFFIYLVHGAVIALDLAVLVTLATIFARSTKVQFIIPDGYQGDVYVIHAVPDGEASKSRWGNIYRIREDGILRVRESMTQNWTRTDYYYQRKNGTLDPIRNFWPNTINPTPENMSNVRDFGVYFPRTGSFTPTGGCSVEFEQFYVGTKAYLLSRYREGSLDRYVRDHPTTCAK